MTQLFVYGTLLPGEVRWRHLEQFVEGDGVRDVVRGTLYDTGLGYPAFVHEGTGEVHGMRFALRAGTRDSALDVLDEIEGAVAGLYRRISLSTDAGVRVFVYEYGQGVDLVPIPGGNWLTR